MKRIDIAKKKRINLSDYQYKAAKKEDCKVFIDCDCIVYENGIPKILYCKVNPNVELLELVKKIKYNPVLRTKSSVHKHMKGSTDRIGTGNIKDGSCAVFGYRPRRIGSLYADFCSESAIGINNNPAQQELMSYGLELSKLYRKHFPDIYNNHIKKTRLKIKEDWIMGNTPFTSGIVNKNNSLKYHFDSGNFKGVLSNMVVFKDDCDGGYLCCPEYDICFEVADRTCIIFDGQDILHGVTPIKYNTEYSNRYSIVYYSLSEMWRCNYLEDEVIIARNRQYEKEIKNINSDRQMKLL